MTEFISMAQLRELLHLGFRRYRPHPALLPWVQCYWRIASASQPDSPPEYFYPDGGSSLLFDIADQATQNPTFNAPCSVRTAYLPGACFGIRFRPSGAFKLLNLPVRDLFGGTIPANDSNIHGLEALHSQLLHAEDRRRVQLVDAWLLDQCLRAECRPGAVEALISHLAKSYGPIGQASGDVGLGRRTAERLVREQAGISPGQLKRWSRVNRARYLIKLYPKWPLTRIGMECGYYDQAHFIHQFKATTTFTPSQYRARQVQRVLAGEMAVDLDGHDWLER